jgi:hypothetical protein
VSDAAVHEVLMWIGNHGWRLFCSAFVTFTVGSLVHGCMRHFEQRDRF